LVVYNLFMSKTRQQTLAPVSVWIAGPEDVMAAQRTAAVMGRSLGLDSVDVFMAVAQTAEQGSALLAADTGCGELVFTPGGSATQPKLSVQAQAADRRTRSVAPPMDLAGLIGVGPALSSGGGPLNAGLRPEGLLPA
jgi:hypothetical protein